jgi:hypothetical protein
MGLRLPGSVLGWVGDRPERHATRAPPLRPLFGWPGACKTSRTSASATELGSYSIAIDENLTRGGREGTEREVFDMGPRNHTPIPSPQPIGGDRSRDEPKGMRERGPALGAETLARLAHEDHGLGRPKTAVSLHGRSGAPIPLWKREPRRRGRARRPARAAAEADQVTAEQRIWHERLRRRGTSRTLICDPVYRGLQRQMKRAIADAEKRGEGIEAIIEALRAANDRIGEHLGLGPRPR